MILTGSNLKSVHAETCCRNPPSVINKNLLVVINEFVFCIFLIGSLPVAQSVVTTSTWIEIFWFYIELQISLILLLLLLLLKYNVSNMFQYFVDSEPSLHRTYAAISKVLINHGSMSLCVYIYFVTDHVQSTIYTSARYSRYKNLVHCTSKFWKFYCTAYFILNDWLVVSLTTIYERSKHIGDVMF